MQRDSTKTCISCCHLLPLAEFYTHTVNGRTYWQTYCKRCQAERRKEWHHTPNGQKAHRRHQLKQKYGITQAEYDAMHAAQRGLCAICHRPETRLSRRGTLRCLAVDHDHATGEIRSLLCSSCNNGIGYFNDDSNLLIAAAEYLRRHSQDQDG